MWQIFDNLQETSEQEARDGSHTSALAGLHFYFVWFLYIKPYVILYHILLHFRHIPNLVEMGPMQHLPEKYRLLHPKSAKLLAVESMKQ